MTNKHALSLKSAILLNLNVMIGTGIFVNTGSLSKLAGFLGFASYLLILLCVLPLILCLIALIKEYPSGGLYIYATKNYNSYAGFCAAWGYFTGKLGSVALLVHVFSVLIQTLVPALATCNVYILNACILMLLTWINTLNMHTGRSILYLFFILKIAPIIFAIITCLWLWQEWTIPAHSIIWSGIPATLPLVLFAFAGFEAICSISNKIENPEKNGPRAIIISLILVVTLTVIYQLLFFLTAHDGLMHIEHFLGIFPTLLNTALPSAPLLQNYLAYILHFSIALASLGGAYSILFSNHWNLYTLAMHNHTFFKQTLISMNKHHIPIFCVATEGILAFLYLCITQGKTVLLQQISVSGLVIAFLINSIAILYAHTYKNITLINPIIAWLSFGSCCIFIITIVRNFINFGIAPLLIFSIIFSIGSIMYMINKKSSQLERQNS